jgi:hypothetical protein
MTPPPGPETVYRGRPQSLDPPVGRRAVRGPVLAVAVAYTLLGLAAFLLRSL